MTVIFDTPVFRPDIGVHHLFASATIARVRPVVRPVVTDRPAAKVARPHPLEARWAIGADGRLACSWIDARPACAAGDVSGAEG